MGYLKRLEFQIRQKIEMPLRMLHILHSHSDQHQREQGQNPFNADSDSKTKSDLASQISSISRQPFQS